MTFVAALAMAALLAILGFSATQALTKLSRKYEQEYIAQTTSLLDSLQVSWDPRLVWRGSFLTAAIGAILGFVALPGWFASALLGALGLLVPIAYLQWMKKRRHRMFQEQLPEMVSQVRTAVACGYTLPMALGLAQRQIPAPSSQELQVVQGHLRLGMPLADALHRLHARMTSDDLQLFVGAITIAERSGGQLGKILVNIEQTIRERLRLERKLRAMTARGRMEAMVVGLAPALLGSAMYFLNPELMHGFLRHPIGIPLLAAGAVWSAIGYVVIRKIMTPEF